MFNAARSNQPTGNGRRIMLRRLTKQEARAVERRKLLLSMKGKPGLQEGWSK